MKRLINLVGVLLLSGICVSGVFAADSTPDLRAQLKAKRSALISSEMNGRIDKLSLRDGERFSLGQTLVRLNCKVEESQLSKALAEQEKSQRTFEAKSRLNTMQSVSLLELEVAKAELDVAKAEVSLMQAMLERCVIVAPFSGKVVDAPAREHQFVRPGDPLLEILDDHDLEIEFIAPSRWLVWLKPGAKFMLHVDENNKTYPAEVMRLGGRVDPVSQTVKVYGRLLQSTDELFPGMSGAVRANPPAP